jgi:hypothetical protein
VLAEDIADGRAAVAGGCRGDSFARAELNT